MARQRAHSPWVTSDSWVVPACFGLMLWLGNLGEEACGWIWSSAVPLAAQAVSAVISDEVILAGWHVAEAPNCGHGILEGLVLQVVGSFLPVLLKLARAA